MPGTISLSIPQTGQPNSTEDPKIASDLTTIQTAINGNLDDTNLFSPNNGVRRLVLQSCGLLLQSTIAGTYYFGQAGQVISSGAVVADVPPMWIPDGGWSGQPQDFEVANKTAYVRLRAGLYFNAAAPTAGTYSVGLYHLTALSGSNTLGSPPISFTFAGSDVAVNVVTNPSATVSYGGVSAALALPTVNTFGGYALGVAIPGTPATGAIGVVMQLYAYNA